MAIQPDETPVRVEAYAGASYPERPIRVEWQGQMRRVVDIQRQWREPERRYFVLTLEDDTKLRLCYYSQHDSWSAKRLGGPKLAGRSED